MTRPSFAVDPCAFVKEKNISMLLTYDRVVALLIVKTTTFCLCAVLSRRPQP